MAASKSTKVQPGKGGKLASKRSKTNDPACSAAMSTWKTSGMTPQVAATLAKCRSMAANRTKAKMQREAGNEAKAQVLEKRADRGLSGKDRLAKARELVASRKAKIDAGIAARATVQQSAPGRSTPERSSKAAALRQARSSMTGDTKPAWLMTTKEHDRLSSSLKINFSGTGGESKYGMGRSSSEKGFKATAERAAMLRDRLSGGTTVVRMGGKYAGGQKDAVRGAILKGEPVPAGKAKRLGIDPSKPLAASGRGTPERAARARELLAQRATPAKPSPLEQARTARAAKGDRTTRLKALAERSMSLAESRATKAGSLSGAAQDRMIDRSMSAAGRYNRLEAARTPYKPATAPAKAATPSRSTPERQAAVQAAKDRLFGKRLDRAFTKLDGPKGKNFQGLDAVRAALPYKTDEFNQRLRSQRVQGRYSLDSHEGAAGPITPSLKAASITEGSSRLAYLSRNSAEPYTPRKASQAKPSLREQAAAFRANKGPAGSRAGRLAAVAKKRADSARKAAEKQMAKAMTAMSTGGTDFALNNARKATAKAEVNSKRLERLAARFAGMKTVQARVVN